MNPIDPQVQRQMHAETGMRLLDITNKPGWKDVLQVLQDIEDQAKQDLFNCEPASPQLAGFHAQARAANVVKLMLLSRINTYVEIAVEVKAESQFENNPE